MTEKAIPYHRPDWPPALNNLLGDIMGLTAYVTEVGTIRLLGPLYEDPDIPKTASSSKINGPTLVLSAQSSLGLF